MRRAGIWTKPFAGASPWRGGDKVADGAASCGLVRLRTPRRRLDRKLGIEKGGGESTPPAMVAYWRGANRLDPMRPRCGMVL
jgi:hypothetical protein